METPEERDARIRAESKDSVIKTLAIIGFIALVVIIVWLIVYGIRFIPNAFNSVASVANSVNTTSLPLTIDVSRNVINSGEVLEISWNNVGKEGRYSFEYDCVDNVSAQLIETDRGRMVIPCDSRISIDENERIASVIFESIEERFIDVPFSVVFTEENGRTILYSDSDLVTVVNSDITEGALLNASIVEETDITEVATTTEPVEEPLEPTTIITTPTTVTVPVTTTVIPTSNPNGFIDLEVTYLGIGTLNSRNQFIPQATLDNDDRGAVRFEVKNIGTRTSNSWRVEARLPTDSGSRYTSPSQSGLRPNERSVITLGFSDLGNPRDEDVEIDIDTSGDTNNSNNDFDWFVEITN